MPKNLLKPDLSKLVSNWSSVSQLRNKLAHAGMTLDKVITSSEKFVAIIEDCKLLLSNCEQLALLIQEYESSAVQVGTTNVVARKWLVSGVGDSPGALYTALIALKPDRVIVVASSDSDINIPAVLVLSGMEPDNVSIKHMKDPFYGFNELDTLFTTQDWLELEGASELVVNITGGTTAMQYVIHKIAQRLETHGVRIVAALDQHGAQEQHSNPLIAGELVEVSNSTRMAAAERQEMDHHNCQ